VLDVLAAEDRLERALDKAVPVRGAVMVVEPSVVRNVDPPLVTVETSAEAIEVTGKVETPPTPSRPEMVVVPVLVKVLPPLVTTVVKVLVATAEEEA
jgi:hypothetical protein